MHQNETHQSVHNDPSTQSDLSSSGDDEDSKNESSTDARSETTMISEDLEVDTSTTDVPAQSMDPFDKWSTNPPTLNEFPFLEEDRMKIGIPEKADAMFFFKQLLSDDLIEEIVQLSNAYAESVINANRPTRRRSMLNEWKDVTMGEMKKFFGVILQMRLVAMPSYKCFGLHLDYTKMSFSLLL